MKLQLKYVAPNGYVNTTANPIVEAGNSVQLDEDWYNVWLQGMATANPDIIFFFTTETTDIDGDSINYKELLAKYIEHVAVEEGSTFLNVRSSRPYSPEFTDEEWAALQALK